MDTEHTQLLFGTIGATVGIMGLLIRGAQFTLRTLIGGTLLMAFGAFSTLGF